MSAKKVIFRMENCGHLPAEVCGVLGRFVRKSTQVESFSVRTSAIFPYAGPQLSAERSAEVCGHQCRHLRTSLRTSMRTSAWIGADVRMDGCGRQHGWMRMSAEVRMDGCGHPQGQRICLSWSPCCVITCWSYVVLHDHMPCDLVFNVCST